MSPYLAKTLNASKNAFLYWTASTSSSKYDFTSATITDPDYSWAEWYTPFKSDIGFWTILGGLQYSGTGSHNADNLSLDTEQAQAFIVRGGEIQLHLNVLDQKNWGKDTTMAHIVSSMEKRRVHIEVWMGRLKADGGVINKPNGKVPAAWHPSMITGLSSIAYMRKKSVRLSVSAGNERILRFPIKPYVFRKACWATKTGWPLFIIKYTPSTIDDKDVTWQVTLEMPIRLCFNTLNNRSYVSPV